MAIFYISGQVIDRKTRYGIPGLCVEAWDKDLFFDDRIGWSHTDSEGAFHLTFDSSAFQELFLDRKPDLFFKIFYQGDLLQSTESSVLWNVDAGHTTLSISVDCSGLNLTLCPPRQRQRNSRSQFSLTLPSSTSRRSNMDDRRLSALQVRRNAAEIANQREHPAHVSNGEEFKYRNQDTTSDQYNKPTHIANFTKGLPHNDNGLLACAEDFQLFVRGIDSGDVRDFKDTPLGPPGQNGVKCPTWKSAIAQGKPVRAWESEGAGRTFDLEGPDAQALAIPPAPRLDSPELITEIMEIYSMALLRDVPFAKFNHSLEVQKAVERLNHTTWISSPQNLDLTLAEQARLRGPFTTHNVFRGIAPGDEVGPYISQFLLVGNKGLGDIHSYKDGFIQDGSIRVDQRVRVAEPGKDYMTTWEAWLDVQNGADLRGMETYCADPTYRFIATPRDMATYVHYDALYEAYLNACLILLGMKASFDPGIPFQNKDYIDKQQGFAHFGGPHILSLVTEVATRALKAVRFQKFNVHRRVRPEGVGGLIDRFCNGDTQNIQVIQTLVDGLGDEFLKEIAAHNRHQNQTYPDRSADQHGCNSNSFLLPMAFPEGSPMHPSYGAGHATVAGACVTILKAFFDHGAELPFCYQAAPDGLCLEEVNLTQPLTVEGELNKLSANIAIARNWAGVHYFTDYIESLRLGEKVALGILQEQKLTYGENFSMTVPLFDGGTVRI
jgi:hypothetical protein